MQIPFSLAHLAWSQIIHGNLTSFLAVWGAILSSVTFGWNLLRDLRDQAKVRISASLRAIIQRDDGASVAVRPQLVDATEDLKVVISVANVGASPVAMERSRGDL
jgi:hypothetical protein